MSDKQQIFDDARKFAAQFGGFLKAAEELAKLGNIEDATAQAKSALKQAQDELETRADQRARLLADAQAHADAKRAEGDAHFEAKTAEAAAIVRDAKAKAEHINTVAEESAAAIKSEAQAAIGGHQTTIAGLSAQVAAVTAEHVEKTQAIADLTRQLDAKRAEIDHATQAHKAFLASIGAK